MPLAVWDGRIAGVAGAARRAAVWLRLLSPSRCVTDSGYSVRRAAVWLRLFSPSRRVTPATQSVRRAAVWVRLLSFSPSRAVWVRRLRNSAASLLGPVTEAERTAEQRKND